jgi:hypothetical protein
MKEHIRNFLVVISVFSSIGVEADINFKSIHEINESEEVHKFGFSKNGDYFYILKDNKSAQIYETNSQKLVETVMSDRTIYEAIWTEQPIKIYFPRSHHTVQALNVKTLNSEIITFEDPGPGPIILSNDSRYLMKGTDIYDAKNKTISHISGLDHTVYQFPRWLSISDDSNTVQMASLNENADGASVLTFVDLETAKKLTSWSSTWLLGSDIIESVLLRGNIAAIGLANNDIKLWSYAQEETVGSLSFEEDITLLKRDQQKDNERLMVWGESKISVWESDNWLDQPHKKTITHGSSTSILYPSLSHDSQLVGFTAEGRSKFQVKSMMNEAENEIILNEFKGEMQGVFSPTDTHLLTINKSRNKLTLWQFD